MATGGTTTPPTTTSTPMVTSTRSLKLPTFSGGIEKDDLHPKDFVERIEAYCKATRRDPNDECNELHLALRGNASIWWRTLSRRGVNIAVWNEVKKEFLATYAPTITGQTAQAIGQLEQKSTETVNDYFGRLDQAIDEMMETFAKTRTTHEDTLDQVRNHMQKYLFIGGLRDSLRTDVLKTTTATLAEALKEASKTELIHKKQPSKIFAIEDGEETEETFAELDEEEIMAINQRRQRMGKKLIRRRDSPNVKCYNCNKMGHIAKNCSMPRRKPIRAIQEEREVEDHPEEEREYIQMLKPASHGNLDFW